VPQSADAGARERRRRVGGVVIKLGPQVKAAIVAVLAVAAATAVYYQVPVPAHLHEGSWITLFCCGVLVLGILILIAVLRLVRAGQQAKVRTLVLLLCLTVLFFSYADAAVATLPGQFVDLHTKTDSVYFNISTLATVGYGDVHPSGQLARSAVTLQIVFNLVFLGAAISIITTYVRARATQRLHASGQGGSATDEPG